MDLQHGKPATTLVSDTNFPAGQTFPSSSDKSNREDHNSERATIDIITSNHTGQDSHTVGLVATEDKKVSFSLDAKEPNTSTSPTPSPTSTGSIWDSKVLRSTPLGRYMLKKRGHQPHLRIPSNEKSPQTPPWKTTLIRLSPLSGILAMFLAVGCIVACLGVLAGSDHQAEGWSVPPSTWIAIFTAIANLLVRYAAIQGVVIGTYIEYNLPLRHYERQNQTNMA